MVMQIKLLVVVVVVAYRNWKVVQFTNLFNV